MEPLILRPTVRQLRGLMRAAVICGIIAVSLAVAAAVVSHRLWPWSIGAVLAGLLFLGVHRLKRGDFTECSQHGIRNRTFGQYRECAWGDIADLSVRTTTRNGVTTSAVIVTPNTGKPFGLAAPVHGGVMTDPDFDEKFRTIRSIWRSNRDESTAGA